MEERRRIERTKYSAMDVIIVCDTEEKFYIKVENISPLGMGISMPAGCPELVGKDVVIVAETMIMFAVVRRMIPREDGSVEVGVEAKPCTREMLNCLYDGIIKAEIDE